MKHMVSIKQISFRTSCEGANIIMIFVRIAPFIDNKSQNGHLNILCGNKNV